MLKDAQGWNIIDNLNEYNIDAELESKIKNFLVINVKEFQNHADLAYECFDEFELDDEENHPIRQWSLNVWIATYDTNDPLFN